MELFPIIITGFVLFMILFLLFQLFLCCFKKAFKTSYGSYKWQKTQFPKTKYPRRRSSNSSNHHFNDQNMIFNNLRYNNTINSLNMDDDNQQTTSDNCDTFQGYKSLRTDSIVSSVLENSFTVFDVTKSGKCDAANGSNESDGNPCVSEAIDSGGGGCHSEGGDTGGGVRDRD